LDWCWSFGNLLAFADAVAFALSFAAICISSITITDPDTIVLVVIKKSVATDRR
jgi:hypothetical protein